MESSASVQTQQPDAELVSVMCGLEQRWSVEEFPPAAKQRSGGVLSYHTAWPHTVMCRVLMGSNRDFP